MWTLGFGAAMAHKIVLLPGDGTGPEVMREAVKVLKSVEDSFGLSFDTTTIAAGGQNYLDTGVEWSDGAFESCKAADAILLGAVGLPEAVLPSGDLAGIGVLFGLRFGLDLYANVRPTKLYPNVRHKVHDGFKQVWEPGKVDLVIVRENTEDLYVGIEYEEGTPDAEELIAWIESKGGKLRWRDAGISIKPISVTGTRRIFEFAFDYARRNGRRKITAVHKANIMKFSDGLWLRVAREVAAENTDIEFDDRIVDNMCMQLVQRPEEYDVLVLPNLYGDVLSDLCAGMIGGLGLAPGANFGEQAAVFEPTHGSAPKYKGQNKVNPMAEMLSGMLMLRHLDEGHAADRLEAAIADVIREGKSVTYDMKPTRDDPTAVGTSEVADAIIDKLGARVA